MPGGAMTVQLTDLPSAIRKKSAEDQQLVVLIELIAQGNRSAFSELYRAMAGQVFRRAAAILRDTSHAEEVTQEVFLELWQRAGDFKPSLGTVSSWVMRLAHSRSVDRVRHVQASRARDGAFVKGTAVFDDESVLDGCIRRSERIQIGAAVAGLTVLQQEAIALTIYRGHSFREASVLLGIPLPTLKTRVRDGLNALRRSDFCAQLAAR